MGDRRRQRDMPHSLPADLGLDDLHPAFFADDATVFHPLVATAKAFIVLDGTEDFCAEKPVTLRFEGPVVDRLRFLDLSMRPGKNLFRRGNGYLDRIESDGILRFFKITKNVFHG